MPSDSLLIMATLIGMSLIAQVASSWLVIWKQPSPSIAHTVLSGPADLRAHRGRHGVPHRAEAAGVEPVPRLLERRGSAPPTSGAGRRPRCRSASGPAISPIRSMTYCGDRLPSSGSSYATGYLLRTASSWSAPGLVRRGAAGVRDLGAERGEQVGDDLLAVAHDRHVGGAVLADLGRVDVGVDDLRLGRERVEVAGHPVVEAGAQADEQIGLAGARRPRTPCRACRACRGAAGGCRGTRRGPSAWSPRECRVSSASSCSSASAWARITPPPTYRTGFSAAAIRRAASRICLGCGRVTGR